MRLKIFLVMAAISLAPLAVAETQGSTFGDVWGQVQSDPYVRLPHYRVTLSSFFHFLTSKLKAAGKRTISDRSDLLPRFDKLVHPNGICLAGTWNVTEDSPYTGYFAKGSRGLVIVRASVAMSDTTAGHYRAFGMAGKLYPTTNAKHAEALQTANFFLVDDLAGTKIQHYTETAMTNHPASSTRFDLNFIAIGAAAIKAFGAADSNPMIRQMYEVSELGLAPGVKSHTPDVFTVRAAPAQSVDEKDFRDELRLANHDGKLVFNMYVDGDPTKGRYGKKIGYLELTEDAVTDSCDHRLHFHHPKWRENLQ